MKYTIRDTFEITDLEKMMESLQYGLDININIEDIKEFINTEKYTTFYLDDELAGVSENETDKARYVWLDTGTIKWGEHQFISLINYDGVFQGYFVGTIKSLTNKILQYNKKNRKTIELNAAKFISKYERKIEDRTTKDIMAKYKQEEEIKEPETLKHDVRTIIKIESQPTAITDMVKNQLMVYNWNTENGLDRYIKIIGSRLQMLIKQHKEEYYILNNIRSAIVNTGLLNKFGADIHVLYKYNMTTQSYLAYKIVEGKNDIISENFTEEQACMNIKPITFFDSKKYFEASIEKFDINYTALSHIVEERRSRFPEKIRDISDDTLALKIHNALDLGLKMQQRDRTYIKPVYNAKIDDVSWVIPLHIFNSLKEEPELVVVVYRDDIFWEIKTVLPYDDTVKDRITDLALYRDMW